MVEVWIEGDELSFLEQIGALRLIAERPGGAEGPP